MIFFWQPHHQRAVGMIPAHIEKLERGAAQRDHALAVDRLVGNDNVRRL
jgi:hypothetical protein